MDTSKTVWINSWIDVYQKPWEKALEKSSVFELTVDSPVNMSN